MSISPDLRFLLAHPAHFIALGAGSGLSPKAPGTVGTLFAWLTFQGLAGFSVPVLWGALIFCALLGLWAIDRAGAVLGDVDHGAIVWDEIVPFWALLACVPAELVWQGMAFVLFRLFDITKPWPASYFDQQVKNPFGVMMDDMVAAVFAGLALWGLQASGFL